MDRATTSPSPRSATSGSPCWRTPTARCSAPRARAAPAPTSPASWSACTRTLRRERAAPGLTAAPEKVMDSERPLSRRDALALLGLGAVAIALPGAARAAPIQAPTGGRLTPFDLRDVRLLDGPFRDAQERNGRYLLSL